MIQHGLNNSYVPGNVIGTKDTEIGGGGACKCDHEEQCWMCVYAVAYFFFPSIGSVASVMQLRTRQL